MSIEPATLDSAPGKNGFWSRLRKLAIVRILVGLIIIAAVLAVFQVGFIYFSRNPEAKRLFETTALPAWVGIAAVIVAYRFFVHWMEKRPVSELGMRGMMGETSIGMALGALMFGLTIGVLALLGCFRVGGFNSLIVLLPAIAAAAISAVIEEIIFRGIIFRITEESLGTWLALAISALLFGAVHMLNPHSSWQGGIAIVLEAGIFLAAAYLVTRRLWFVIGAHFGWNFTEGGIFGAAVSGNSARGLITGSVTGPDYLSGGIFGVEASFVAVTICLLVAILLLTYAGKKGRFVAPFWRR